MGFPYGQVLRCKILGSQISGRFVENTVNVFILFFIKWIDSLILRAYTFTSNDLFVIPIWWLAVIYYFILIHFPVLYRSRMVTWSYFERSIWFTDVCMWLRNLYMEFYTRCYFVDLYLIFFLKRYSRKVSLESKFYIVLREYVPKSFTSTGGKAKVFIIAFYCSKE